MFRSLGLRGKSPGGLFFSLLSCHPSAPGSISAPEPAFVAILAPWSAAEPAHVARKDPTCSRSPCGR